MNLCLSMLSESAIDRLMGITETADQSVAQQQVADPDYWGSVGIIALMGILVVFLILAVLIFFFWLMGTVFKCLDKSKKKKREAAKAAEKPQETVQNAVSESAVEEISEVDDGELIAVIGAAIAAYSDDGGFTIKSVKKHADRRSRSAWSAAGITENTRPF